MVTNEASRSEAILTDVGSTVRCSVGVVMMSWSSTETCRPQTSWGGLLKLPNRDPLLGPVQDNGGPTFTHALLPGSPAIDAGDDSTFPVPRVPKVLQATLALLSQVALCLPHRLLNPNLL